jgi:hypothetical protein
VSADGVTTCTCSDCSVDISLVVQNNISDCEDTRSEPGAELYLVGASLKHVLGDYLVSGNEELRSKHLYHAREIPSASQHLGCR